MAIIKCKMCGGDLRLEPNCTIAECEYCGTRQTVPNADDEKKLTLFARAGRLRAACDFDKAAGIYESIIADFPEEAEAYWGLVLCKYGIEYVDDPATGKKVPTCHRSSFDGVLDDVNYEQAVENSDMATQQVYREEAKQLERLRRDIISVSSGEEPYDIFICYKETDSYGDRTLDSVLAQDLYSALTGKGYRVFFSRITLQGKLGQAYEPYIFAALQSAKVMLAVGTRYEHYTAVWVKNEWSRFLKLCQQSKDKHLIPCYKDLDPEDIPREFNHLQGADLGKMGAIQDILFNIEKYIPLKKQTVVRQQVIVNEVSDQKLASMLDRGRMALEDGDFANADGFFEEVLNNDSKNARAYLGKFLANQRCASLSAFEAKCMAEISGVKPTRETLPPDQEHIDRIIAYYGDTFARKYNLKKLYQFNLQYTGCLPNMQRIESQKMQLWETDKQLTKSVQFADAEFAAELAQAKERIREGFEKAILDAQTREQAERDALMGQYTAHLTAVDSQAAALYAEEQVIMEQQYAALTARLSNENSQRGLRNLAQEFDKLGSFKDAKDIAENCRTGALEMDYQEGLARLQGETGVRELQNLSQYFEKMADYKDSRLLSQQCLQMAEDVRSKIALKQEQERQRLQEVATANRTIAKCQLWIFLPVGALLFGAGWRISYLGFFAPGDEAWAFGVSYLIQVLAFFLPTVFFLAQVMLRGKKDKAANVLMILTLVVSGLGILVWGIIALATYSAEADVSLWALSHMVFNILCAALSFLRKR